MVKTRTARALVKLTETYGPFPQKGKKYKQNWGSEVAHRWAGNEAPEGRNCHNGNIYFHNGTIYSYGPHFPMARHVRSKKTGCKFILFTSRGYSPSTSGHKRDARQAIPEKTLVFTVPNVMADTRQDHLNNLKWFQIEALDSFRKSKKARENKGYLLRSVVETIRDGNRYAETVGLTERIGPPQDGDLASWEEKALEEARIAQAKAEKLRKEREAKAQIVREKRRKEEDARNKRQIDKWEKDLVAWQAGERIELPNYPPLRWDDPRRNLAWVRVSRDKYLQTTMGMSIPLTDVLPILTAIRGGKPGSDPFTEGFKIQEWDGTIFWEERLFTVGCHRISFDEIERAAKVAGL